MKKLRKFTIFFVLLMLVFNTLDVRAGNNGGTALDFDYVNDWVNATNNGANSRSAASLGLPTAAITAEAWIYPRASRIWDGVVGFLQDNGAAEYGWHLGLAGGNRFEFAVAGGGSGLTYLTTTNTFPLNRWYHLAGTYDGTTMRIYVNGVLEGTSIAQSGAIAYLDSWLAIGNYRDDNENWYFNGMIDEVRIWNYARSQAQLQSSMFGEISGATAGLVAYWRFNEGTGTTTADATGNALHLGTLTNMTPASDWIPSTAPLGDVTVNAQTNVAGFWIASQPTTSGGLTVANNSFLVDTGDDVIFGHNTATGTATSDLPVGVGSRLSRIWYCDLNDQIANGGNLNLTFNLTTAGGGAVVNDATYYSLLERAGTSGPFAAIVATASSVNTVANTVTFTGLSSGIACSYITLGANTPYVVSITRANPSPTNAASVDFTVTFSKSVSGVDTGDFMLTVSGVSGASVAGVSGSGATRTVTVNTGSGDGTLRLDLIDNDTIVDTYSMPLGGSGAGNGNYTAGETYTIDKTAPTITSATSTTANGNYNVPDAINITLNFSESISSAAGLTITLDTGGVVNTGPLTNVTSYSGTYTVGAGDNSTDLTISSITGTITDVVGNNTVNPSVPLGQNIADNKAIVIDTANPVTTASPAGGLYSVVQSVTLACSDVGGTGCASTLYCLGAACAPVTPYAGAININTSDVLRFYSTDNAGNSESVQTETYTIDTTAPTVTSATSTTANGTYGVGATINITINFSENISSAAGLTITLDTGAVINTGTLTNVNSWSGTYTVGAGENSTDLTVTSITGTITDTAGNNTIDPAVPGGSNIADSSNIVIDTTAPGVTVEQATGQPDPTNMGPILFTVTFSEPINTSTFTAADVVLSASTAPGPLSASITEIAPNDGTTFEISVSGMSGNGDVIASIAANTVQDLAGNDNNASNSNDNTVTYDISALTVTVEQATTQSDPTNVGPIVFTVTFNKPINTSTFTAADVVLSASTAPGPLSASITEVAPNDGTTFEISVSGMSGNGDVIASIDANTVQDLAGNDNDVSNSIDNTATYDTANPSVVSTDLDLTYTGTGPANFTVTFSKDVSVTGGATGADSAINPANYLLVDKVNGTADTSSCGPVPGAGGVQPDDTQVTVSGVTYDSATFTATVTLPGSLPVGSYRLFVCGTTSIVDAAGNPLNGGNDYTFDFVVNAAPTRLPATGFPQGRVTVLPAQPAVKAYVGTDMVLEIPSLNQKMTIVGVPQTEKSWDITWLGNNAGWLAGSAYPTWEGNTVLTGHVWDSFNRPGPFANLKNLKYGDQFFIHAYGMTYTYEVRENKTYWAKTAVSKVFQHEELDWVTLVTCETYNPVNGDYFFRRAVRAVLISVK